jgi:hypothetical protein
MECLVISKKKKKSKKGLRYQENWAIAGVYNTIRLVISSLSQFFGYGKDSPGNSNDHGWN